MARTRRTSQPRTPSRGEARQATARPHSHDASAWMEALSLLGDPLRIRLLRLLCLQELGVGELARVVQVPQSTVSRHLKPLFDARWLVKRAEGTTSLYRHDPAALGDAMQRLWAMTREQIEAAAAVEDDDHRLAQVLAERRADSAHFFGRIGGDWRRVRAELFGGGFTESALLGLLDPAWTIADIGCGTGEVTEAIWPLVRRVIAVDRETSMLKAARKRLAEARNVEFRTGEIAALPLRDGEVDAAIAMLVVHHLDDPRRALAETARTLRRGGVMLVVDMVAHDREHWRHTMGHLHLGFTAEVVEGWNGCGGLALQRFHRLRPDTDAKGPGLFAALFRKA